MASTSNLNRGRFVVLTLLCVGTLAGIGAVYYWAVHHKPAAAIASPEQAAAELDKLEKQANDAIAERKQAMLFSKVEEFVHQQPQNAAAHRLLGQLYAADGRFNEAYEQFTESIRLDPAQANLHSLAGTVKMNLGDYPAAERHYRQAIALDSKKIDYRLLLAKALMAQKNDPAKLKETQVTLLTALKMDSDAHEAYAIFSTFYAQQNNLPMAIDMIDKAIDHAGKAPRDTLVDYVLHKVRLQRRVNPEEAVTTIMTRLTDEEKTQDRVLSEWALAWAAAGKPAEAAKVYEDVFEPMISHAQVTDLKLIAAAAKWRIAAGDPARARDHLEQMRVINKFDPLVAEVEAEVTKAEHATTRP